VKTIPNEALICSCHQVSKKGILEAIGNGRCSVSTIAACTRAGTGCGGSKLLVQELIDAYAVNAARDPRDDWYVPGVPYAKPELIREIRARGLKSVSAVFRELADGEEDASSKMGLASLLKSIRNDEYEDERDARFINDRVHANIHCVSYGPLSTGPTVTYVLCCAGPSIMRTDQENPVVDQQFTTTHRAIVLSDPPPPPSSHQHLATRMASHCPHADQRAQHR
jgi:bacterioferritin-associated ferredoxin